MIHEWTTEIPNHEGWYAVRLEENPNILYEGRVEKVARGFNFRAAGGHDPVRFFDMVPVEWLYMGPTAPVEPLMIIRSKRGRRPKSAAPAEPVAETPPAEAPGF